MQQTECEYCGNDFSASNGAKFCSRSCKQQAYIARNKPRIDTPIDRKVDTSIDTSKYIPIDTLERILSEREARHKSELDKLRSEMELRFLEKKVSDIEKELKESSSGGIGMDTIMQFAPAIMGMFNQNQPNEKENTRS